MTFFQDRRVVVTGPHSMIGGSLCKQLVRLGANIFPLPHEAYNLLDWDTTFKSFNNISPDFCFHLASYNGNINFNKEYPETIFYRTAQIGLNVLRACIETKIKKVCSLISSCSYSPDYPLDEDLFFDGKPHDSVEGHGFAKKMIVEYGRQIHKQHNIDCINVCVNHVYGPYDSIDLTKTKVMMALIKKFTDAKHADTEYVELWGTGQPKREFIYVDDVAKYLCLAFEKYNDSFKLLNIGSKTEISIKDLAELVKKTVGFQGDIRWNGWPDGQNSKLLENHKMKKILGDLEFTPIEEGIQKTVEWYENFVYNSH